MNTSGYNNCDYGNFRHSNGHRNIVCDGTDTGGTTDGHLFLRKLEYPDNTSRLGTCVRNNDGNTYCLNNRAWAYIGNFNFDVVKLFTNTDFNRISTFIKPAN